MTVITLFQLNKPAGDLEQPDATEIRRTAKLGLEVDILS
jgi:hypothetical protein